ncbi:MAG: hypothetical protein AB8B87_00470 [Granulosicoccus sp.]
MKPVLHIGAVIETRTPAVWVSQLLQKIIAHEDMQLHVGLHEKSGPVPEKPAFRLFTRLADWLLNSVIDIPQFDHDPWELHQLTGVNEIHDLSEVPDALANCDVILNLTSDSPESTHLQKNTQVWTADLPLLEVRVKHGLLTRAPFLWIHLWNLQCDASSGLVEATRIASHALPCQTYSISDLRRLSYSALAGVFLSRLTWMVHQPDNKLAALAEQNANQGVFDTEEQHALHDIQAVTETKAEGDGVYTLTPLWSVLTLLVRQTYERIHRRFFTEYWQLAVTQEPSTNLKDISNFPIDAYTTVGEPSGEPRDVMWADPHLCQYQGDTYIFFEKMHKQGENAHIAYLRLDDTGQPVESGVALSAEHHLSFPYIFTHDGSYYMIPETASLRSINLYKATHFPDQWEHQQVLLSDINAADTVLWQHLGRWWMFTNCQSHRTVDERDELHIFYADNLHGPWQAHTLNPVLTGVDRSRMAGPLFRDDDNIYRCSQYGAYRYGYGINISRIDELTPENYRESASWRILPRNGAAWRGCHAFGRLENLTIIDRVRFGRR